METGRYSKSDFKLMAPALLYEFCGSCFLFYVFNLAFQNAFLRAAAYMLAYVIAYSISGGHFNPATSLAVFMTEKRFEQHKLYLILVMIVQLCGMYAGELITFLLVKNFNNYELYPVGEGGRHSQYFYEEGGLYFGRIVMQEIIQTFFFTLIFLILRYDQQYSKVSVPLKAIALFHVLAVCYAMCAGAGSCLNPALGMA